MSGHDEAMTISSRMWQLYFAVKLREVHENSGRDNLDSHDVAHGMPARGLLAHFLAQTAAKRTTCVARCLEVG